VKKAYNLLDRVDTPFEVNHSKYSKLYYTRDSKARKNMQSLLDSDKNRLETVFSDIIKRR